MVDIYKSINPNIGGGGSGATAYTSTFDATTSWGSASLGLYSINILESVHGKGANPVVQIYELRLGSYELVDVDALIVDGTGNVTMVVTQVPDTRFQGKIIILGE